MRTSVSRAVLRIKTREVARQLDTLTTTIRKVRGEIEALVDPRAQFAALQSGILAANAHTGRVFEDASYADGVAEEIRCGTADDDMVRAANARLERELHRASRRAAAAVVYGRLFDETEVEVETTEALPGLEDARAQLLRYWGSATTIDTAKLRLLLEDCCSDASGAPLEPSVFSEAVSSEEVVAHLLVLSRSFDHRQELRVQARRLMGDVDATGDLAGALTILARDPGAWTWEDWPTRVRLRWNRTRWRAFLDPELIPQLFLEVIALRLGVWARTSWLPRTVAARRRRWDAFDHTRHELAAALVLPGLGESIAAYAHQVPNAYGGAGSMTGEPDHMQRLFSLLSADLWWHRTTATSFDSYDAAQTDLKDFFPSLPHDTVTTLLEVMRVPPAVIDLIGKYLRGPYLLEDATGTRELRPQAGIFPGNTLSRVLGDALLIAMDAHVERSSGVAVARFMDDIYWVAPGLKSQAAEQAIEAFAAVAGLHPNREKMGVQRFGSGAQPALPDARRSSIRWGFLELGSEGAWAPHRASIDELVSGLRVRLEVKAPVLQIVREYNAAIGYLVRGLAALSALDVAHVDRLHAPLHALHAEVLGPAHGVVTVLRDRLSDRLPELQDCIASLPQGWFYWPTTAGGLGVFNPASMLAGARAALSSWSIASAAPSGAPRDDASMCALYATRARADLRLAPPRPSPEMEGRQRDFVARGASSSAHGHAGLQPYWQWLIETHGPSLVEFFGTLRFLGAEVVPLQQASISPRTLLQTPSADDDIPF